METSRIDFKALLGDYDKDIQILLHSYPDPDALSSALGMHHYLLSLGYKVGGIYYSGEVSHPQNMSMLNILNLKVIDYDDKPFEAGSKAILVDTNNIGPDSNQQSIDPKSIEVIAVIDHHKGKNPKSAKVDSRTVGACASIVWDYLSSINYDFSTEEGAVLATALATGISTDTDSLMSDNIADLDFQAYQHVIRHADKKSLTDIMRYPLPPYLFELRQKAFDAENKRMEESTMVSGVGIVSPSKRDALPIIADEFLRMTGVTTSVVFAIVRDEKDEFIDISIRSKNQTIDVGQFLQRAFGAGGGKKGAGRATIPLGFFGTDGDQEFNQKIWDLVNSIVHKKVFSNIKGE
jgi:nanoRNase/pAp phosphatase (c-di-AMP/oligoRNAs hydrolase)